ncbi:MAG: SH3 domain-containing protein [Clostridia bacterium]|nr:SH3 domain-containing protein [Clostridia bacterium]
MKKVISLILSVMLFVLLASAALSESQGTFMYVYTQNGKVLRVRSTMSTSNDSNVIGSLPYGAKVIIYGVRDGWAMIDYGNTTGYVMYRFLVKEQPAPYNPSGNPDQETKETKDPLKEASTVAQMNALIASAKFVESYTVTVRPVRASGWVYMRWFPSRAAEAMATFGANYELTVIAELKDWYQVNDPATGKVGFIYKSYVQ